MSRGEGGGLEVRPSHLDRHTGRGRRAGESTARDDILAAARELFSASGFDRTTMRAVAERAGVDPALISHYFGSKQGLFLAATEFPADPQEVLRPLRTCPHDEIGATALRAIITVWDSPAGTAVVARFRQAVVADEQELFRSLLTGVILPIVRERIGEDDAELRLGLFASQVAGIFLTRHVVALPPIATADVDRLVAAAGPTLQRYLTGPLD